MAQAVTKDSNPAVRWGVYVYLSRETTRFQDFVDAEWAAMTQLEVPPSVAIAVQQDSAQGARRLWRCGSDAPLPENLGRLNHGSLGVARGFLSWARGAARAERTILILGGTGVLDPWSSVGAAADPTRTFAVCDDEGAADALDVSELHTLLDGFQAATRPLDILVLDMSAMQWLEVAYQFKDLVRFVVAAQAPVNPGPLALGDLIAVLGNDRATAEQSIEIEAVACHVAETLGNVSVTRSQESTDAIAPSVVSAMRLDSLETVAMAFDTFSHALMLTLGEEVVWNARQAIADAARTAPFGPAVANGNWKSPFFVDHAYDFAGLMKHSVNCFKEAQRGAIGAAVAKYLARQDTHTLFLELGSIAERVSSSRAGRKRQLAGSACTAFFNKWERLIRAGTKDAADVVALRVDVDALGEQLRSDSDEFWMEWAAEKNPDAELSARLGREIEVTAEGVKHAKRLESLAQRVLDVLVGHRGKTLTNPLILARYPADSPACGIAIYRPVDLDRLLNANYLRLDFNRRSHWAALLAVINLVRGHARALWRVIESVLSTAPLEAREALLARVFGPTTVVAGFREQLTVLASPPMGTLSISDTTQRTKGDGPIAGRYVVRYTPCKPLAVIHEHRASITLEDLSKRVSELDELLQRDELGQKEFESIVGFGKMLGDDVLEAATDRLQEDFAAVEQARADRARDGQDVDAHLHVQLQLPRVLTRYPWELMHDDEGCVANRYAIARQISVPVGFTRSRPRIRCSKLRALVIASPVTKGAAPLLPVSDREGTEIAATFSKLADELGDAIDFRPGDSLISQDVKVADVRNYLRSGVYDIIHFSGHGTFQEKSPEKAGWVLSDGVLTVQNIRNSLRSSKKPPWLVYASACESGKVMYQDELHGVASAFITNGVAAYIGSMWRVADSMGYRIAVRFYEGLCLQRLSLGHALLEARNSVQSLLTPAIDGLEKGGTVKTLDVLTAPSFVLFGDPTAKALDQLGTAPPDDSRRPTSRPNRDP